MMQARFLHAVRPAAGSKTLDFELVSAFDFTSAEYVELFNRSDATVFQHPLWLDRTYARLADTRHHKPVILLGRAQAGGQLVFVLPMVRRRLGPFSMLDAADLDVADYNAAVVDRIASRDPANQRQMQRALRKLNFARVRKVRDGTMGFAVDPSMQLSAMDYKAHEVELTTPVDGWQHRTLKPDFARYLRSKRKRLAAKGAIALDQPTDPGSIRAAFESMRGFRQDRWEHDLLRNPEHFEFYVDIAISGCRIGFARTYVLTVNGKTLSVLFGVYHNSRFCFLLLGFDRQNFRNHSTGLLILESVIEDCIRRENDVFDLTIGDEEYKRHFATRTVPMSTLWLGRRPWIRLAPSLLVAAKKARSLRHRWRTGKREDAGS